MRWPRRRPSSTPARPTRRSSSLATAELGPLDELQRARSSACAPRSRSRAAAAATLRRCCSTRPGARAARRGAGARDLPRGARAAIFAGRLDGGVGVQRGRPRPRAPRLRAPSRRAPIDLLLDGLATRFTEGYAGGVPPLQRRSTRSAEEPARRRGRHALALAGVPSSPRAISGTTRPGTARRPRGRPRARRRRADRPAARAQLPRGRARPRRRVRRRVGADRGGRRDHRGDRQHAARATPSLLLAAWRGGEADALGADRRRRPRRDRARRGTGGRRSARHATAVLYNGLGRYEDALAAPRAGVRVRRPRALYGWALAELVEAGARSGDAASAPRPRCGGSRSGRAPRHRLGARHRGPLARAAERGRRRRAALPRGDRAARPHPHRRRTSPAPTCCTANGCAARAGASTRASSCAPPTRCSAAMGAEAFAERARRELLATGETVRKRTVETRDELTAQEAQIARLAARRAHEPRDRRAAVHQPAHRRVPPAQGVHEARHQLPTGASQCAGDGYFERASPPPRPRA